MLRLRGRAAAGALCLRVKRRPVERQTCRRPVGADATDSLRAAALTLKKGDLFIL